MTVLGVEVGVVLDVQVVSGHGRVRQVKPRLGDEDQGRVFILNYGLEVKLVSLKARDIPCQN